MRNMQQRKSPKQLSDCDQGVTPKVSIIIPVFNKLAMTRNCLLALEKNTPHDMIEVIVIDNASTDGTSDFLSNLKPPFVLKTISNEKNKGYAKANNQGARIARGQYLLLLNNDTVPQPNWLPPLVKVFAEYANVGAVGAKLLYPDGTIQHAGVITGEDPAKKRPLILIHFGYKYKNPNLSDFNKLQKFPAVTGACVMVPKSLYQKVGGLDEIFWNGFEDVDFCFKILEEGLDIYFQPESVLIHHESQSGDQRFVRETENSQELVRRWKDRITCQFLIDENRRLIPNDGVTIVIVTCNSMGTIHTCLAQLERTLRRNDEVIIVDNASLDRTSEIVRRFVSGKAQYQFIQKDENWGYAKSAKMGANAGRNPYIVFLNPATIVTPEWIEHLLFHLTPHKVAAVGPLTDFVPGFQHMAIHLSEKIVDQSDHNAMHEIIWNRYAGNCIPTKLLMDFCLMVKRKTFDGISGNGNALFLGNDNLNLSWRLRQAGFELVIANDTLVYHQGPQKFAFETKHDHRRTKGQSPGDIVMPMQDDVLRAIQDPFFSDKKDVAIWILERLIEAAPEHGDAHHELGMLYFEQKQLAKAQAHLNQAVRYCAENYRYYKDIGDFYHVVHKDSVQALKMYEKAIELNPSDAQLSLTAAHLCTAEKRFAKAMVYYQQVLEIEPGNQAIKDCLDKINNVVHAGVIGGSIAPNHSFNKGWL